MERIERSLAELEAAVLPLDDTRMDEPVGLEPTYDLAVYRSCNPAHNLSATAHQKLANAQHQKLVMAEEVRFELTSV